MAQSADVLERPAVTGVSTLEGDVARFQRRLTLIVTIVPFIGFIVAMWTLWGRGISPADFGIFLAFYVFTGLGVTIGFHRLFTHRSFETTPWMRTLLAVAGSMAVQGPIINWVADHRRHHAYSDKEGDPHSPHLDEGPGVGGVVRGLWHAHVGWFFDDEQTSAERWAPDLLKDERVSSVNKHFPLWVVFSFVAPAVVGLVITASWQGALTAFLWGSLARIFFLHHVTWSVNSICHFYGDRPFKTPDFSTNNWLLSIVSFGESWHNNHHAFPTSAVHGMQKGQFDVSAQMISLLERLGVVRGVRRIPVEKQVPKLSSESVRPRIKEYV
jgi:stearoyl-CoA desaturase (Delta-9 desaturase)